MNAELFQEPAAKPPKATPQPPSFDERMQSVRASVCVCADRVWELLSPFEQRRAAASPGAVVGRGTLQMLAQAWNVSTDRACLLAAERMALIVPADAAEMDKRIRAHERSPHQTCTREFQERDDIDFDSATENAAVQNEAGRHDLVVVQGAGNHRVFWQGNELLSRWGENRAAFSMLLELIATRRAGTGVNIERRKGAKVRLALRGAALRKPSRRRLMTSSSVTAILKLISSTWG